MKRLLPWLLIACITGVQAAEKVFDCEVTAVNNDVVTVTCDAINISNKTCAEGNQSPNCLQTILDIPLAKWGAFSEWSQHPEKGQLLKGSWAGDRRFYPVANCAARTQAAMDAYCGGNYCRPPINSLIPEDCH